LSGAEAGVALLHAMGRAAGQVHELWRGLQVVERARPPLSNAISRKADAVFAGLVDELRATLEEIRPLLGDAPYPLPTGFGDRTIATALLGEPLPDGLPADIVIAASAAALERMVDAQFRALGCVAMLVHASEAPCPTPRERGPRHDGAFRGSVTRSETRPGVEPSNETSPPWARAICCTM
jgi:hypothetical protein